MKEKDISKAFFIRFQTLQQYKQFNKNVFVFHVANEQNNNPLYTMQLKKMGLIAGVADYCILIEGGKVAFMEFKRNAKCKLSEAQKQFQSLCESFEIPYAVVWDVDNAIDFIKQCCNM